MAARLAQANLASKDDNADLVMGDKLNNLNKKLLQIKKNHVLVENVFKKLQTFMSFYQSKLLS